jgi:hypothetical protein
MRVMELGVQELGTRLRVSINPKEETWHQILLHVNKAIEAMPVTTAVEKAAKAEFAACSAHLNNVRIAWRNEVMHPKATYTEEESKDVFNHVKTFFRIFIGLNLLGRIDEPLGLLGVVELGLRFVLYHPIFRS